MFACDDSKGRLLTRRLRLNGFDYEVLYPLRLIFQELNALSILLYLYTEVSKPIEVEVRSFETGTAALEQRLKVKKEVYIIPLHNSFDTTNSFTLSRTVR